MDRIAAPWGERTAVARGAEWPARVDLQLEEGLGERDVERWVMKAGRARANRPAQSVTRQQHLEGSAVSLGAAYRAGQPPNSW